MVEDTKPEAREEGEVSGASAKHPLETRWTLWFDNPKGKQVQATWGQTMRKVYTFGTVEDFWCVYNNILAPSRLMSGSDLYLFREGIEPKWEDPSCAPGGKWTHHLPRGGGAQLDTDWLHVVLACIGEQFEDGDEICGVVANIRGRDMYRVAMWTRTATNEAAQMSLGRRLKEIFQVPEEVKMGYIVHGDAKINNKPPTRYSV